MHTYKLTNAIRLLLATSVRSLLVCATITVILAITIIINCIFPHAVVRDGFYDKLHVIGLNLHDGALVGSVLHYSKRDEVLYDGIVYIRERVSEYKHLTSADGLVLPVVLSRQMALSDWIPITASAKEIDVNASVPIVIDLLDKNGLLKYGSQLASAYPRGILTNEWNGYLAIVRSYVFKYGLLILAAVIIVDVLVIVWRFRVVTRSYLCTYCGYDVRNLNNICPECGRNILK